MYSRGLKMLARDAVKAGVMGSEIPVLAKKAIKAGLAGGIKTPALSNMSTLQTKLPRIKKGKYNKM